MKNIVLFWVMMQRGISVFNALLFEDMETLPKQEHRGRSPELLDARDRLLLHRFYYKSRVQGKQYQKVLKEIESELFLSVAMIQKIIQSKSDTILHIKRNAPTPSQLRSEFPFMVWN